MIQRRIMCASLHGPRIESEMSALHTSHWDSYSCGQPRFFPPPKRGVVEKAARKFSYKPNVLGVLTLLHSGQKNKIFLNVIFVVVITLIISLFYLYQKKKKWGRHLAPPHPTLTLSFLSVNSNRRDMCTYMVMALMKYHRVPPLGCWHSCFVMAVGGGAKISAQLFWFRFIIVFLRPFQQMSAQLVPLNRLILNTFTAAQLVKMLHCCMRLEGSQKFAIGPYPEPV